MANAKLFFLSLFLLTFLLHVATDSPPSPSPAPSPEDSTSLNHIDVDEKTEDSSNEGGMSGSKKAGIAIGIIVAASVLTLTGMMYKKRTHWNPQFSIEMAGSLLAKFLPRRSPPPQSQFISQRDRTNDTVAAEPPVLAPFNYVLPSYSGLSGDDVLAKCREHLSPSITHLYKSPLNIVEGKKQYPFDENGRRYVDVFGGIATKLWLVSFPVILRWRFPPTQEQIRNRTHNNNKNTNQVGRSN